MSLIVWSHVLSRVYDVWCQFLSGLMFFPEGVLPTRGLCCLLGCVGQTRGMCCLLGGVLPTRGCAAHCKGFVRLVARVGSCDPVRVLRLYTTITLDEVCSIYCWDICTTCHYRSTCYSTCASGPTALSVCSRLCLVANCSTENWALVLYCTMPFIATCVDAIGTVFWDCPVLRYPGKALILVAKLLLFL